MADHLPSAATATFVVPRRVKSDEASHIPVPAPDVGPQRWRLSVWRSGAKSQAKHVEADSFRSRQGSARTRRWPFALSPGHCAERRHSEVEFSAGSYHWWPNPMLTHCLGRANESL